MGTWDKGQEEGLQAHTLLGSFISSITSYEKIQTNFLANPREPEEEGKVWVSESGVKFSVTGLQHF